MTTRVARDGDSHWLDYTLVVLPVLAVLLPSVFIGFVSDDLSHITTAAQQAAEWQSQYWRPLTNITLALDSAVWGLNPVGFHFTNLLLHLCVTLLVYHLARLLSGTRIAALISALLFGLHPIHGMAIFWISGRGDLLCGLFYIGALIAGTKYFRTDQRRYLVISLVLFILALLAKEMAISLPLVLLLLHLVFAESPWRARLRPAVQLALPYLGIALIFVLFRLAAAGSTAAESDVHRNVGLLTMIKNLVVYAGLLVVPGGYTIIGKFLLAHPAVFIVMLVIAGAAIIVSWRWISRSKISLFAALFALVALFPVARLVMRWYLYIPSVGFCILLGYLIGTYWRSSKRRYAAAGMTLLLLVYTGALLFDQMRWGVASENANRAAATLAQSVDRCSGNPVYILAVPAEVDNTPVLMYGLSEYVGWMRQQLDLRQDDRTIIPVTYVSMNLALDLSRFHVTQMADSTWDLSLEETSSTFIFPDEARFVNRQWHPIVGDSLSRDGYVVRIISVSPRGVDRVHVYFTAQDSSSIISMPSFH